MVVVESKVRVKVLTSLVLKRAVPVTSSSQLSNKGLFPDPINYTTFLLFREVCTVCTNDIDNEPSTRP